MKSHFFSSHLILVLLTFVSLCTSEGVHLTKGNDFSFLNVNNHPFIVLSIEDHEAVGFGGDVRQEYFAVSRQLNANTISVTFRWFFFEKRYGVYDTTILRNVKNVAEKNKLKVILLWFGSNVSGYENCVPDYILNNPHDFLPYTRRDKTIASLNIDNGGRHIFCYSFDSEHANSVLEREINALQALMHWIKGNDAEETFIMLQLGNELFVHPALWRPWPPVNLTAITLTSSNKSYEWDNIFYVSACSLKVVVRLQNIGRYEMEFTITDTIGKTVWNRKTGISGGDTVSIGGDYVKQPCKLAVRLLKPYADTIIINNISIEPVAERCYCRRCQNIYLSKGEPGDQQYQQDVFLNYIRELTKAIDKINPDFPIYLNMLVSHNAKMLLGNPFQNPQRYLDEIPDLDFIAADIYIEHLTSLLDDLNFQRNIIFVPEAGQPNDPDDSYYLKAFSLIFDVIGTYKGLGIQIYDLKDSRYSLLSSDWQWWQNAYLLRNSYSAISLLPSEILIRTNHTHQTWGFRNVQEKTITVQDMLVKITPITDSKYARGLFIKMNKQLIVCGIGFRAEIHKNGIHKATLERGFWNADNYVSQGKPKPNSCKVLSDYINLIMDQDDYSSPDTFNVSNNQYCIIITLP